MNELKWVGSGPDRTLMLGFVPKISIDPRIRCPKEFTQEFPPPPPPTARYGEIASRAAGKILEAVWSFRRYVEVIKVWYLLEGQNSPTRLFLVGELVIAEPTGEKFTVSAQSLIADKYSVNGMTFELQAKESTYESILGSLTDSLVRRAKSNVQLHRKAGVEKRVEDLNQYQKVFE